MTKTWGIVGLGWLGLELSSQLQKINQNFWGTRTDTFNFQTDKFPEDFCDVLFLNTPPLIKILPKVFVDKIHKAPNARVIFISSTSVYGNGGGFFTESSPTNPSSERARWLVDVEGQLREKFQESLTIVRPGGLIGGERHPVYSLSRRGEISNGGQAINLIHRSDLISICLAANTVEDLPLANAVAPYHPTKKDYYTQWAAKLNLPLLTFVDDLGPDRQIDSEILPTLYPNWICPRLDFLTPAPRA